MKKYTIKKDNQAKEKPVTRRAPVKSLAEIYEEVSGYDERDCGKVGKLFEPTFRYWLLWELERYHPSGVTDIVIKSGVALEVGQRCKPLTEAMFYTEEEAWHFWKTQPKPMKNATHVAYSPTGTMGDFPDTRVYTQREFIKILEKNNLVRTSKYKGKIKLAIQTFYTSKKRNAKFVADLQAGGETPHEFINRMFK